LSLDQLGFSTLVEVVRCQHQRSLAHQFRLGLGISQPTYT
jgi:hypothetical protein